jgi:FSR family fosmidomycin resistance protein-like MFS transporter
MQNMHLSLTQAGILVSVFSLFNSLLQPLFGWMQDRIGHYFFLCAGPFWVGLFMGTLGFAPNFGMLVLLLLLAGLGICAFHPASFAAVGNIGSCHRVSVISFLLLAMSLGFVVGPSLISLFISAAGMERLYFISVPGIVTSLVLFNVIPRNRREATPKSMKPFYAFKSVAVTIAPFFLFVLFISVTAMNLYSFVPILFRGKGFSVGMTGFFLSAFALGCAVGPLLGSVLAKRLGRFKTIFLSAALSIVFLLFFLTLQSEIIVQIIFFLLLGVALMFPFSILMDMAQEKVPQYLSTVSSLLGGFTWGCGGVLVFLFASIAEIVGIEKVVDGMILFPLLNLGLVFASPSFRSRTVENIP